MITVPVLIAAGIPPTQAKAFADPLSAACALFDIGTIKRQAAFIAQAAHESANFTQLEENLFYTKPSRVRAVFPSKVKTEQDALRLVRNPKALANCVYANRLGNGDEASGDGWRFRGRGLFQLTGRFNYRAAEMGLNRPYVTNPDLVAEPSDAALTAAWFWYQHGCNVLVDAGAFDQVSKMINGPAMLGAAERRKLFADTQLAFVTGSTALV
jgi:putative chitinase